MGESLESLVKKGPLETAAKKATAQAMLNQHGKPVAAIPETPPEVNLPEGDKQTQWEALKEQVLNDPVCQEHLNPGAQVVFGVGSVDADIFFCGEAPGGDEEEQGEPFVGKAGALLTKIITAMGLSRDQVYIGNIMNWRPEMPTSVGNRPPTPEEMAYCLPYLRAQIEVVKPKVIVALGMTAVNGLLGPDPARRMGAIRGQFFEFDKSPLLVTYHPSYLLRYATMKTKRLVWEDMLLAMENIGLPISEKQRGFFQ
jgi:DNA polymerase